MLPDPADEAMCGRARERYTADRNSRFRRRRKRHAELPNLIIIGGLKCGTTSIHHYLGLHPEIQMSKPKELNFFVEELNLDLGIDWYASRFDGRFKVRGESSPHYTNLPRFDGTAERIHAQLGPDVRLIYMVRDPIKRILSHWVHATGAGYETGDLVAVLSEPDTSYMNRSKYWMQLQPYLERFDRERIAVITQEELQTEREETMRRAFRFAGVDEGFTSEQFDREWEKSSAKQGDKYQFMERLIKLPGLPLLRPQLRPAAGVDALDRREGRPRPGEAAGAEAEAPRRPLRDDPRPIRRRRRRAAGLRRPRVRRLARLLLSDPDPPACWSSSRLRGRLPSDRNRERSWSKGRCFFDGEWEQYRAGEAGRSGSAHSGCHDRLPRVPGLLRAGGRPGGRRRRVAGLLRNRRAAAAERRRRRLRRRLRAFGRRSLAGDERRPRLRPRLRQRRPGRGPHERNTHLVPDGLLFSTAESLTPADTDSSVDIYRRWIRGLSLVSPGQGLISTPLFESVGEDGSTVVFTTEEPLSSRRHRRRAVDLYESAGSGYRPPLARAGGASTANSTRRVGQPTRPTPAVDPLP